MIKIYCIKIKKKVCIYIRYILLGPDSNYHIRDSSYHPYYSGYHLCDIGYPPVIAIIPQLLTV